MRDVNFVFCRLIWEKSGPPFPFHMPRTRWHDLYLCPEPGAPFGRKGRAVEGAWKQLAERGTNGLLLMDGDVVIDPLDFAGMLTAIAQAPELVHVAPARLWPASTQQDSWTWAHWADGHGQTQHWTDTPDRFSFNFTYLPRKLIVRAMQHKPPLNTWQFPNVDQRMSQVAKECGIKAKVVPNCWPKHLHY